MFDSKNDLDRERNYYISRDRLYISDLPGIPAGGGIKKLLLNIAAYAASRLRPPHLRQQWRGAKLPSILTMPGCSTTTSDHRRGRSHAAIGDGHVSGPMHSHGIGTRLGQGDSHGNAISGYDLTWSRDDWSGIRDGIEGPVSIRPDGS